MEFRPYQTEAINTILSGFETQQYELLQAPTGAGKTVIFAGLIKRLLESFNMRILILGHREILMRQTVERLREVWPEIPVSLACAAVGEIDLSAPVVVGSVQTLSRRLHELPMFQLVVVDEVHRLQPRGEWGGEGELIAQNSSYNRVLERLLSYLPATRILGVTATPYRLGHGYIYGDKCTPGTANWFPELTYRIPMKTLVDMGALVPFHGMVADDISTDLACMKRACGDFNSTQLSDLMTRTIHLDAAVEAFHTYGENRQSGVVFCVDIEHSKTLAERFQKAGIRAETIHSELSADERLRVMSNFNSGITTMLMNVGVLVEGWDCPKANLIMFCRPTLAPALYVQMLGRGLRPFPGKTDCLLIDLVGNYARHGHPDFPTVKIPRNSSDDDGMDEYDDMPLPSERLCSECKEVVTTRAWICPECGHLLLPQADIPTLRKLKIDGTIARSDQFSEVVGCEVAEYRSKAGNDMLRCCVYVKPDKNNSLREIQLYPDFSGYRALYWRSWWETTIKTIPPKSNQEALTREWKLPKYATCRKEGNYWRVGTWIHT